MITIMILLAFFAAVFLYVKLNNYEIETGGIFQIKDMKIETNNSEESKIVFDIISSTESMVEPSISILEENDPIYVGEKKVKDTSLGKYRVELMFNDTRFQKSIRKNMGLKKHSIASEMEGAILESLKVAYPPDDSKMVIYFGCNVKPQVIYQHDDNKFEVILKKVV
ncbi:MAG TPA: hypothetical protein DCZ10_11900 [Pelotomaculum sp.]|nr:hypothetical protein [Pelotomaculum sp.]